MVNLAGDIDEGLGRQIEFLVEIDTLKNVERMSVISDASRRENTAEHSWHLAMCALVLADRAGPEVDLGRAILMCLVHDIVEVDAGDTYIYAEDRSGKAAAEAAAADRLFGLLPVELGAELRSLWEEYEAHTTPTGAFAYAIDRLQPMLLNAVTGGRTWTENGIRQSQVRRMNQPIEAGSADLWMLASGIIETAVAEGVLGPD